MLHFAATDLKTGELSASIEVPVKTVRNMVVPASIARSTASNMEAVIGVTSREGARWRSGGDGSSPGRTRCAIA